jgi:hypothetical protein
LYKEFINQLVSDCIEPLDSDTKIGMMIDHEFFNYPINLPLIDKHELDASMIWSYFHNVVQSKKDKLIIDINTTHKISVSFKIAKLFKGGSKRKLNDDYLNIYKRNKNQIEKVKNNNKTLINDAFNIESYINAKNSIVVITNNDNYCLIRAVLIAIAYFKDENSKHDQNAALYLTKLKLQFDKKVKNIADLLLIENETAGYNEYIKLEKYFVDYQIMIIGPDYKIKSDKIYLNEYTSLTYYQ